MNLAGWVIVSVVVLIILVIPFVLLPRAFAGQRKGKAKFKGFGMSVDAEASNDIPAGIQVEDASSTAGGLQAKDTTGRGIRASRVHTKDDISLTTAPPPTENAPPKR